MDLESMIDTDAELAATDSTFEADTEAIDGPDDENRGITFDAADDPNDSDSDDRLTFDDGADDTLEAEPIETTDGDQLAADALESNPGDDPVEPAGSESEQAAGDESAVDGQLDGDAGEIGAEEILGIEERDDGATDIGTSDTTDGSPDSTDPLAEETETADPLADTTETVDPLAEETESADPLADDSHTSAPLGDERDTTTESGDDDVDASAGFEPAGDSATDLEQGSTAGDDGDTEPDESTTADGSSADDAAETADDDDESTESDDVFTFGTASDEDDE